MEARQEVAERYRRGLGDVVKVPAIGPGRRSAFAQYAIETEGRDALKAHLAESGIPTAIYYPKPLHRQKAYGHYPRQPGGLPVTEALPDRILCLPMHAYLAPSDQERIIDAVRRHAMRNRAEAAA
jgi:dTDP-4-amino-4,6-dideoxygalactose transaminase